MNKKYCSGQNKVLIVAVIFITAFIFVGDKAFAAENLFNVDSNTISLWRFNDATGSIAVDEMGRNNGTAIGASIAGGKFGSARYFNGVSDYITVPDESSLKNLSQIAIESWIYPTGYDLSCWTPDEAIVEKGFTMDNQLNGYTLHMERNWDSSCAGASSFDAIRFNFRFDGGGRIAGTSTSWHAPNNWYYVVGTYDGSNVRIYVNGVLEGVSESVTGIISNTTAPLYMNHHTWGFGGSGNQQSSQRMRGLIDEVRISNIARSAQEIANNYNLANGISLPPTVSALAQFKVGGVTVLNEGSNMPQNAVVLGATVNSSSTNQLQLQVQLSTSTAFTSFLTATSAFVSSGAFATTTFQNLVDGQYYWRAKTVDSSGLESVWQEFGVVGVVDFQIVPPAVDNFEPNQLSFGGLNCANASTPSSSAKNLVFITHGWRGTGNDQWVQQMSSSILNRINLLPNSSDWAVCAYDWSDASDTLLPFDALGMFGAYRNAGTQGDHVGQLLAKRGWERIHFIGHSAGANLIQHAANFVNQESPTTTIHLSFLDAYDPSGSASMYGEQASSSVFATPNWWAEQYVDKRQGDPWLYGDTNISLNNAFNFDVTPLNPYPVLALADSHAWPYEWYQGSVSNLGNFKYGFPLSLESGTSSLPISYGKSGYCLLTSNDIECTNNFRTLVIPRSDYSDAVAVRDLFQNGSISVSPTGKIQFPTMFSARMETGSPVWFEISTTTTAVNNVIKFDYQFLSASGAQGVLTVFIDGRAWYSIDERTAPSGLSVANNVPIGDLQPGLHKIGFRLDPFTSVHSVVEIGNIQLGYHSVQHTTDNTSPITTSSVSGDRGSNNWYISNVSVVLTATDTESGVRATYYSLDGAATSSGATVSITTEGSHTLSYYSVDNVGNVESPTVITVKIDKTAPEAKIYFNKIAKGLNVEGIDKMSSTTVAMVSQTNLDSKDIDDIKHKDDESESSHAKSVDKGIVIYKISDEAGHVTTLKFRRTGGENHNIEAALDSIQYDNGAVITIPKTTLNYEWSLDKNKNFKSLSQEITAKGIFEIEAQYTQKQNKTQISVKEEKRKVQTVSVSGLVIIKATTQMGKLGWKY